MQLREWFEALRQDVRYAARGLRREPLFAAFVIVTLALGIGANAAMFGVADRLLLRGPEHINDPSRVMRVYLHEIVPGEGDFSGNTFGYVMYDLLAARHALVRRRGGVCGVAAQPDDPRTWHRRARSSSKARPPPSLFPMLGVKPALGRFFTPDEDMPPRRPARGGDQLWALAARFTAAISSALGKSDPAARRAVHDHRRRAEGFHGPAARQGGRLASGKPACHHVDDRRLDQNVARPVAGGRDAPQAGHHAGSRPRSTRPPPIGTRTPAATRTTQAPTSSSPRSRTTTTARSRPKSASPAGCWAWRSSYC